MFDEPDVFGEIPPDPFQAPPPALEQAAAGTGSSSDGIGASPDGVGSAPDGIGATSVPLGDPMEGWEPTDVSPPAAARSAGITALIVAVSLGVGIAAGGPWGAGAGLLLAGAAFNGYRAQKWWGSPDPSEKHEAVVSSVFAAAGLGLGGYMGYRAYKVGDE